MEEINPTELSHLNQKAHQRRILQNAITTQSGISGSSFGAAPAKKIRNRVPLPKINGPVDKRGSRIFYRKLVIQGTDYSMYFSPDEKRDMDLKFG